MMQYPIPYVCLKDMPKFWVMKIERFICGMHIRIIFKSLVQFEDIILNIQAEFLNIKLTLFA